MVKLKTFKLDEYEDYNKFILKYPTDGKASTIFTGERIVLMYDDGKDNPAEKLAVFRKKLTEARRQLLNEEMNLSVSESNLNFTTRALKGYTKGMSHNKLKELIADSIGKIDLDVEKMVMAGVDEFENKMIMATGEIKRLKIEIETIEKLLAKEE